MAVVNITPPVISGIAKVGLTLSTTRGTWTSDDPLTYTYQWMRCDSAGANCVDIGGATDSQYTCVVADVGSRLRSEVTATEVAPPNTFGELLPDRLAESAGATVNVSSLSALNSALSSAANGSIINITASINGGGATLTISRQASAAAPITITSDPGVVLSNFTRIYFGSGAYIRLRGLEITAFTGDGVKITSSAHHIEIDGCEIHDGYRQGILITSSAANVQIWNNRIYNCGSTSNGNLDHGIYFAYASGTCVIANNLLYDNCAYNVQLYPNTSNVIYTCNTVDGGMVHGGARGGTVIGSESGQTNNTITVGYIGTGAAWYAVRNYHPGSGNNVYDSLGFDNDLGDFQTGSGITYTNCVHDDPEYVNAGTHNYHLSGTSPAIDFVDPARHGYVPPEDIDGNPRITADAGCYAA
jgi:hypothetical protein